MKHAGILSSHHLVEQRSIASMPVDPDCVMLSEVRIALPWVTHEVKGAPCGVKFFLLLASRVITILPMSPLLISLFRMLE
jgi:hypothetical protein